MVIYEQLRRDHHEIRDVMADIESTSERAVKRRTELLHELKTRLLSHAKAEEVAFYRSILDDDVTHEQALEALEEHKIAETVLHELEEVDPGDDRWMAKFRVLRESLERHMDEEEKDIFQKAEKIVSRDEAEEMGDAFMAMRKEVFEELRLH